MCQYCDSSVIQNDVFKQKDSLHHAGSPYHSVHAHCAEPLIQLPDGKSHDVVVIPVDPPVAT